MSKNHQKKESPKGHKTPKKEEHINHATHKVTKEDVKNNPGEGLKVGEEVEIPLQSDDMSLSQKDPKNAAGESIVHKEEMEESHGTEERPEEGKALNQSSPNIPEKIGDDPVGLTEEDKDKSVDADTKNAAGQSDTHAREMGEKHGSEKRSEKGFNKISEDEEQGKETPHSPGTETSSDEKNAAGQSALKTDLERESEKPS
jgi:hypothetical protein